MGSLRCRQAGRAILLTPCGPPPGPPPGLLEASLRPRTLPRPCTKLRLGPASRRDACPPPCQEPPCPWAGVRRASGHDAPQGRCEGVSVFLPEEQARSRPAASLLFSLPCRQHRPPAPTCGPPRGTRLQPRRAALRAPSGATPRLGEGPDPRPPRPLQTPGRAHSIAEKTEVLEARAPRPGRSALPESGPARAAPRLPRGGSQPGPAAARSPRAPGPLGAGSPADGQAATTPGPIRKALPSRSGSPGQGALEPHQPHSEAVKPELSTLTAPGRTRTHHTPHRHRHTPHTPHTTHAPHTPYTNSTMSHRDQRVHTARRHTHTPHR